MRNEFLTFLAKQKAPKYIRPVPKSFVQKICPVFIKQMKYAFKKSQEWQTNKTEDIIQVINNITDIPGHDSVLTTPSYYFPETMKAGVQKLSNFKIQVYFEMPLTKINVHLSLVVSSLNYPIQESLMKIYMWLIMVDIWCYNNKKLKERKTNEVFLFLYLMPGKKEGDVLTTEFVNSAYAHQNARPESREDHIVIFREEEWFKVFIHETFHLFNMDLGSMDTTSMVSQLSAVFGFPQHQTFLMNEMYSETCATIINAAYVAFFNILNTADPNVKTKAKAKAKTNIIKTKDFCSFWSELLYMEQLFALWQGCKMIQLLGIEQIILPDKKKGLPHLSQQTHIFEYYILKMLLMANLSEFLNLCTTMNSMDSLLFFKKKSKYQIALLNIVKSSPILKHPEYFLKWMTTSCPPFLKASLRMTLLG